MSLPPATSRAALPFTQRLLGAENFDNSFCEYTSVILAGEDLTEMATNCAQVETVITWCVKTLCFRQDELPSHLSNYPQVEVVDAIKADQAATAVANAMAKAAGVVEEPGHPSSTPFAKVTYQAVHRATLPAAIQATPASTTALIAKINAAVARFVSRPPAIAVAQATGTATTAKTAAITATNQDDRRHRSRSTALP
ncbi:hypothetical protein DYB37_013413, partial [Aphanomyces astaci]